MFTYGEAEAILAGLHGADRERQAGAFRARLKHFKKLGIPLGVSPGRGKKIQYSREQFYQWVFCLECSQFGFDPTWTVEVIKAMWPTIYDVVFKRAEERDPSDQGDIFMHFAPEFMTFAWSQSAQGEKRLFVPHLGSIPRSDLDQRINKMGRDNRRLCLLNVSNIVEQVRGAEDDIRNRAQDRRDTEPAPQLA